MFQLSGSVFRGFFVALLAAFPLLWLGCAAKPPAEPERIGSGKRVAFLGYKTVSPSGPSQDIARDPLSGSLFDSEPVTPGAADLLNGMVLDRLLRVGEQVISPEEGRDFVSSEMGKDIQAERSLFEVFAEVGRSLEVDGVLVGHVYRWRERQGTDFAVDRPASAAFDLNLIRSSDGTLVWRGKFDKTQRSLSENMLDFFGFFRRGARWQKVEDFAASGLDDLFKNYPDYMPKER